METINEKTKAVAERIPEQQEKEREAAIARQKEIEDKKKLEEEQQLNESIEIERAKKELEQTWFNNVMNKYITDFVPKVIGSPDYLKTNEVEKKYTVLCGCLNDCRLELSKYFNLEENFPIDKFFDFILNKPAEWLPKQYFQENKISIPVNMNIDRVIEMKLINFPATETLISKHKGIIEAWNKIQSFSFIPAMKLYDKQTDVFKLTCDFFELQDNFLNVITTTPEQNVALELIEKLYNVLYELSDLQIINLKKGLMAVSEIQEFFLFRGGYLVINPAIFKRVPRLKKYGEVSTGKNNIQNLKDFLV